MAAWSELCDRVVPEALLLVVEPAAAEERESITCPAARRLPMPTAAASVGVGPPR